MKFEISKEDADKIENWVREREILAIKEGRARSMAQIFGVTQEMVDEGLAAQENFEYAYWGATGGSIEYRFTPTSLGVIFTVYHHGLKEELDLTDYESW